LPLGFILIAFMLLWLEMRVAATTTTSLNNFGVECCSLDSAPALLLLPLTGHGGEGKERTTVVTCRSGGSWGVSVLARVHDIGQWSSSSSSPTVLLLAYHDDKGRKRLMWWQADNSFIFVKRIC
jgi:hypothetical protein